MTKITGAMLHAIKRSKMTEAEILERLKTTEAAEATQSPAAAPAKALNGSAKKRTYNRRDMRAGA